MHKTDSYSKLSLILALFGVILLLVGDIYMWNCIWGDCNFLPDSYLIDYCISLFLPLLGVFLYLPGFILAIITLIRVRRLGGTDKNINQATVSILLLFPWVIVVVGYITILLDT